MSKIRFHTCCPACSSKKIHYFICPCGGDLYLNEEAKLICNSCLEGQLIFNCTFDCKNRENGAHKYGPAKGCYQGFLRSLSNLGKIENLTCGFMFNVVKIIFENKDKINEIFDC